MSKATFLFVWFMSLFTFFLGYMCGRYWYLIDGFLNDVVYPAPVCLTGC